MADEVKMWNGGTTNKIEKQIREWNRLLRATEDFYDLDDSEREFREELVKREKLMKEEAKYQKIQSKYSVSNQRINKDMDKPCEVSRMGGKGGPVQTIKSKTQGDES